MNWSRVRLAARANLNEATISEWRVEKFREAARQLETDESEENFDRMLRKVAKSPPPKDEKAKADKE
ncbi:hypothetical protein EOA32_15345 [Mesorhizobium sp. M1A.F.Ca.ET.072.01.1.1]|nr:hypothetical protein EOA32_15345 [Mesorhizobium sp. M1A.F.Ca.ET.072.01.1.1]TIU95927.1 MAG: hypothetical protein E5W04_29675 [Mesorhizobium sp.]